MQNLKPRMERRLAQVPAMKKKTSRCPFQTEAKRVVSCPETLRSFLGPVLRDLPRVARQLTIVGLVSRSP